MASTDTVIRPVEVSQAKEQKAPVLEVLFPEILAGIEEPADSTILWVDAGQVRALVKIAVMAG